MSGAEKGGAAADAITARGDAITRALRDVGVDREARAAMSTVESCGGAALGDAQAHALHLSLGLPAAGSRASSLSSSSPLSLLHYILLHKASRQMTSSAWMTGFAGRDRAMRGRRKALLRALAHAFEAVTAPVPAVRHYISAFSTAEKSDVATVVAIAAINTSGVILLAAWGALGVAQSTAVSSGSAMLPTDRIAGLMEKAAKVIGKDADRLFLLPGPPSIVN